MLWSTNDSRARSRISRAIRSASFSAAIAFGMAPACSWSEARLVSVTTWPRLSPALRR